jgi:hypothetical protein
MKKVVCPLRKASGDPHSFKGYPMPCPSALSPRKHSPKQSHSASSVENGDCFASLGDDAIPDLTGFRYFREWSLHRHQSSLIPFPSPVPIASRFSVKLSPEFAIAFLLAGKTTSHRLERIATATCIAGFPVKVMKYCLLCATGVWVQCHTCHKHGKNNNCTRDLHF